LRCRLPSPPLVPYTTLFRSKKNVLIIGAGGVAQVVAHKCAQNNDVLGDIHIASRTRAKCDQIIASVHEKKAMKQPGVLEGHALEDRKSTRLNSSHVKITYAV